MLNAFTQYVSIYRLEYFNIIPELSRLGAFYVGPVIPTPFSVILNCQLWKKGKRAQICKIYNNNKNLFSSVIKCFKSICVISHWRCTVLVWGRHHEQKRRILNKRNKLFLCSIKPTFSDKASYCFTLFICGGPCHLSSFKERSGDLIFLSEKLVHSVMERINILVCIMNSLIL